MELRNSIDIDKANRFLKGIEMKIIDSFFPDTRVYSIAELVKEDEIFFQGGANKKKDYYEIDIFDLSNFKWQSVVERSTVDPFFIFDKTLAGHSSIIVKNKHQTKIVVYGGFDGISYSNSIYEIEVDDFQLKQLDIRGLQTGDYPLPRAYHTCNYDEETQSFYVFGGWNGNILHANNQNFFALWRFDFITLTWKKLSLINGGTSSSISLRGHTSNKFKNKLIMYGGVTGFNKYSDKIYEIDLEVRKILFL